MWTSQIVIKIKLNESLMEECVPSLEELSFLIYHCIIVPLRKNPFEFMRIYKSFEIGTPTFFPF